MTGIVSPRAQLLERGEAIDARHHEIQHDDGRPFALQPPREIRGVVQNGERNAALLEELAQQVAQFGVVVDEQDLQRGVGDGRCVHFGHSGRREDEMMVARRGPGWLSEYYRELRTLTKPARRPGREGSSYAESPVLFRPYSRVTGQ